MSNWPKESVWYGIATAITFPTYALLPPTPFTTLNMTVQARSGYKRLAPCCTAVSQQDS